MTPIAIILARFSSSRLRGKVLLNINGNTIIGHCVQKIKNTGCDIVVATSNHPSDDPIQQWCEKNNINCHRGDLNDVAGRVETFLLENDYPWFFRINADSPFLQEDLLLQAKEIATQNPGLDMVTNVQQRTFPYGIAVELIKTSTFVKNYNSFNDIEKEHITTYFYQNQPKFNIHNISSETDYSNYRFVLDDQEDLKKIEHWSEKHPNLFQYDIKKLITLIK